MAFYFSRLESLRLLSRQIQQEQPASLKYFAYEGGYQHYKGKNKISVSSTATCVLSLVATDSWPADKARTKELLKALIHKTTSARLPEDNPFTIAWILEAVTALEPISDPLEKNSLARVKQMEKLLRNALKKGSVAIETYPPSAYLTQLVVRALKRRRDLTPTIERKVRDWAWAELKNQLALIYAKNKTADPLSLGYLIILVTAVTPSSTASPQQTSIQRAALQTFFDCQLDEDGTWPLSQPLFHYPNFGNAYCYEYEMLTQLLLEPKLEEVLFGYLPELGKAAQSLLSSGYRLDDGVRAWSSGHHPQLVGPESWTTASVYHFAHMLDRLLAQAVRRELFRYLEVPFPEAEASESDKAKFASDFLDCNVDVQGNHVSLKDFLWEHFVEPIASEIEIIGTGRSFTKQTPRSAIFFGPPGTSKTQLSSEMARFLGWPHLAIDPSHFLRNGMEGMQAEANIIFRMLAETERVVVLFDEFDELVRERGSSNAEPFSRLLTTAMLPKLASIHKKASLVFIIATNNIEEFDFAIRRQGRFDRVLQIMPPTYEAKITKKDWGSERNIDLEKKLRSLKVRLKPEIKTKLADLTYGECEDFATSLSSAMDAQEAIKFLTDHWARCTLNSLVSKEQNITWKEQSQKEAKLNR
jgi:hypothetical protein